DGMDTVIPMPTGQSGRVILPVLDTEKGNPLCAYQSSKHAGSHSCRVYPPKPATCSRVARPNQSATSWGCSTSNCATNRNPTTNHLSQVLTQAPSSRASVSSALKILC